MTKGRVDKGRSNHRKTQTRADTWIEKIAKDITSISDSVKVPLSSAIPKRSSRANASRSLSVHRLKLIFQPSLSLSLRFLAPFSSRRCWLKHGRDESFDIKRFFLEARLSAAIVAVDNALCKAGSTARAAASRLFPPFAPGRFRTVPDNQRNPIFVQQYHGPRRLADSFVSPPPNNHRADHAVDLPRILREPSFANLLFVAAIWNLLIVDDSDTGKLSASDTNPPAMQIPPRCEFLQQSGATFCRTINYN